MTADPLVLCERRGAAALITLNAPHKRNAIDRAMVDALHRCLDELQRDDQLAALVITGAGEKAFAAGADIGELRERRSREALLAINSTLFKRIEEFPAPVIAAIKGYALGGGCELAIACDLRVAGESAKLGQPEVKLGIIPGAGATYRLPRLVGLGKARELIYTGRILDARECLRIGLVNEVVADDQVVARALAVAEEIAGNGRLAVRLAKATINAVARPSEGHALLSESAAQAVLFDSAEKLARMDAFLDKGKSKGKGKDEA
jgi:enoyl-CoA hydratase